MDFATIRKFGSVKISPPSSPEQFEEKIKDLAELSEALVYWGDIVKRQKLIKFISGTQKLKDIEEYIKIRDTEMTFISSERQKFLDDNAGNGINFEALKLAQQIDKESRVNKLFDPNEVDDDDKDSDEDNRKQQAPVAIRA